MHNDDFKKVPFFRFWCQRVIPLVYDSSLSYYELLCKVVDYLNNVIKDTNALIDDNTQLHKDFDTFKSQVITANAQLKAWVSDYFKNLDVQDEINNKLDDLVADGYFDTIVNNYLSLHTVNIHHFTVADMVADESLKKGYFVTTEGYNTQNDLGGCDWYITDTPLSSMAGVQLNNNLFAKRLLKSNMFVECFGAYGDGLKDDSVAIKNALSSKVKILFRANHKYKVKSVISIAINTPIMIDGNNATIVIDDGTIRPEGDETNGLGVIIFNGETFINNLNFDYKCTQLTHTICPVRVNNGDTHIWHNVNIHSYQDTSTSSHANVVWFNFTEKTNGVKYGCSEILLTDCDFINDTNAHDTGAGALWITGLSYKNQEIVGQGIDNIICTNCTFKTSLAGDTVNIWMGSDASGTADYKTYITANVNNLLFKNCIFKGRNDPQHTTKGSALLQLGNSHTTVIFPHTTREETIVAGFNVCDYKNVVVEGCRFEPLDFFGQEILATTSSEVTFNINNCYFVNNQNTDKSVTMCIFNNHNLGDLESINNVLKFNNCHFKNKNNAISTGRTVAKNVHNNYYFKNCDFDCWGFYPETNCDFYNCNFVTTTFRAVRDRRTTGTKNEFNNNANFYNCYFNNDVYLFHSNQIQNCTIDKDLYIYTNSDSTEYQTATIQNNFLRGIIRVYSFDVFDTSADTAGKGVIIINNCCKELWFNTTAYSTAKAMSIINDPLKFPRYQIYNNAILTYNNAVVNFSDSNAVSVRTELLPYSDDGIIRMDVNRDELSVLIEGYNVMFGGYYSDKQKPFKFKKGQLSNDVLALFSATDTEITDLANKLQLTVSAELPNWGTYFDDIKNYSKSVLVSLKKDDIVDYFELHSDDLPTDTTATDLHYRNQKYVQIQIAGRAKGTTTNIIFTINIYCV